MFVFNDNIQVTFRSKMSFLFEILKKNSNKIRNVPKIKYFFNRSTKELSLQPECQSLMQHWLSSSNLRASLLQRIKFVESKIILKILEESFHRENIYEILRRPVHKQLEVVYHRFSTNEPNNSSKNHECICYCSKSSWNMESIHFKFLIIFNWSLIETQWEWSSDFVPVN